jgi:hypothetical protein
MNVVCVRAVRVPISYLTILTASAVQGGVITETWPEMKDEHG